MSETFSSLLTDHYCWICQTTRADSVARWRVSAIGHHRRDIPQEPPSEGLPASSDERFVSDSRE